MVIHWRHHRFDWQTNTITAPPMTSHQDDISVPIFEIDQADAYGQYFLNNRLEILINLRALQKQRSTVTLYLDDGAKFFLSSVVAVDEENGLIFLDPSNHPEFAQQALAAQQVTLSATLDRVKIQLRLPALHSGTWEDTPVLSAPLPIQLLRLQRREFFRLETPHVPPLRCKLAARHHSGVEVFDLPLFDISGGGLSLIGKVEHAEKFSLGELFQDCRLEIPGESVLSVNLRVREILKIETVSGEHQLRLGCEFVSLPGTRLTLIERYITRLERERKLRQIGMD